MELTPDLMKKIAGLEIARKEEEEEDIDNQFINLDEEGK
jgi:hypothetical protein